VSIDGRRIDGHAGNGRKRNTPRVISGAFFLRRRLAARQIGVRRNDCPGVRGDAETHDEQGVLHYKNAVPLNAARWQDTSTQLNGLIPLER
jgi:hypothetical protein